MNNESDAKEYLIKIKENITKYLEIISFINDYAAIHGDYLLAYEICDKLFQNSDNIDDIYDMYVSLKETKNSYKFIFEKIKIATYMYEENKNNLTK